MASSLHYEPLLLLVTCLHWLWRDSAEAQRYSQDYFIGANLTIYFSKDRLKTEDFRGPDFFLVKHTNPAPRNSWVIWEEGD